MWQNCEFSKHYIYFFFQAAVSALFWQSVSLSFVLQKKIRNRFCECSKIRNFVTYQITFLLTCQPHNTWKFQAQSWGEHVVYRNCCWYSEQFLYTTCSPHVLQKKSFWQRFTCNINFWSKEPLWKMCSLEDFETRLIFCVLDSGIHTKWKMQ